MQFHVAIDEFLRVCAVERRLSSHTLEAYSSDLADFQRWLPRGTEMRDILPVSLKKYLEDMVERRRLSAATVRRRLACLRAFFRRLADLGEIADPFVAWQLRIARRRRLPLTLTRKEIAALLWAFRDSDERPWSAPDAMFQTAVRLMIATGVRVGELCRLRIDDVSPDGSALRVHGKGSRDRVAYVPDGQLRRELQRLIALRRNNGNPSNALFLNRCGSRMRSQSIRSKLRQHAAQAGLTRRVTPHMLRHTAATLLIESGVDIRFVQRLLGHSSIATTEIYTHVSDEALRTTLERADVLGMLAQR
jgi:site-specific recombinase XerD